MTQKYSQQYIYTFQLAGCTKSTVYYMYITSLLINVLIKSSIDLVLEAMNVLCIVNLIENYCRDLFLNSYNIVYIGSTQLFN